MTMSSTRTMSKDSIHLNSAVILCGGVALAAARRTDTSDIAFRFRAESETMAF